MKSCERCHEGRAVIRRPKDGSRLCKECFYYLFEEEVHETIVKNQLFKRGERVAIAASGGKGDLVSLWYGSSARILMDDVV